MMKLTLLASLFLLSVVFAACPADYTIPNLIAGTAQLIQIPCKYKSPNPKLTHHKPISTPSTLPSHPVPQSP